MGKGVEEDGRVPWSVVERVGRTVIDVPVTTGLIALGAGVIVWRALLDVAEGGLELAARLVGAIGE